MLIYRVPKFEEQSTFPVGYMLTAKKPIMESPDAVTTGTFIYRLHHPPSPGITTWVDKLDDLARTSGMGRHFYVVEMIELIDTR